MLLRSYVFIVFSKFTSVNMSNILNVISYILKDVGMKWNFPSIHLVIHPSSSSRKKKMMEEEDNEWWQQQFIQMFMWSNPVVYEFMKNSCSFAICQKLQTNF